MSNTRVLHPLGPDIRLLLRNELIFVALAIFLCADTMAEQHQLGCPLGCPRAVQTQLQESQSISRKEEGQATTQPLEQSTSESQDCAVLSLFQLLLAQTWQFRSHDDRIRPQITLQENQWSMQQELLDGDFKVCQGGEVKVVPNKLYRQASALQEIFKDRIISKVIQKKLSRQQGSEPQVWHARVFKQILESSNAIQRSEILFLLQDIQEVSPENQPSGVQELYQEFVGSLQRDFFHQVERSQPQKSIWSSLRHTQECPRNGQHLTFKGKRLLSLKQEVVLPNTENPITGTFCPEFLVVSECLSSNAQTSGDLWTFGLLLWEFLHGRVKYPEDTELTRRLLSILPILLSLYCIFECANSPERKGNRHRLPCTQRRLDHNDFCDISAINFTAFPGSDYYSDITRDSELFVNPTEFGVTCAQHVDSACSQNELQQFVPVSV